MEKLQDYLKQLPDDELLYLVKELRDSEKSLTVADDSKIRKLIDSTFTGISVLEIMILICKETAFRYLLKFELEEIDKKWGNQDIKGYTC